MINSPPLGPYSRTKLRALWWSFGGGVGEVMSEVPLYSRRSHSRGQALNQDVTALVTSNAASLFLKGVPRS